MIDLALVWAGVLSIAVLLYVVLDGFDLGIGIVFPLLEVGDHRDRAMNSIAPVWDGNETWLVLGGGGLFAAFPLAYGVLMTAFYAPLVIMLLGLDGKRILVAGASRGIGLAVSEAFLREGARVALLARSAEPLPRGLA